MTHPALCFLTRLAVALTLLLALAPAHAERLQCFGDYEVHYNAFPSSFLQPEVARAYKLLRSRLQGVLLVSVHRQGAAVPARVEGEALNSVGQAQHLVLRQVSDGEAIYHVGNVRINNGESLRFRLSVRPDGEPAPLNLNFTQQFFSD